MTPPVQISTWSRIAAYRFSRKVGWGQRLLFTLVRAASKKWRKLNGTNQLPRVIEGVTFTDGVAQPDATQSHAA